MKNVKAFEDAVASARVHIHACASEKNEPGFVCWSCLTAKALVDAHVELEQFRLTPQALARCDLGHIFVNRYRVDGGCPFCHQLMDREKYIDWIRGQLDDLGDFDGDLVLGPLGVRRFCDVILKEARPSSPMAPKIQYVAKMLTQLHDRTSDPALKKYIQDELIEPLKAAVQP